eukprot:3250960-Pleurochrysis_carterae.AAC.2
MTIDFKVEDVKAVVEEKEEDTGPGCQQRDRLQVGGKRWLVGGAKREERGGAGVVGWCGLVAKKLNRRIYVILRKRRVVPFVAGESGDRMAPLIHHRPSKY